MNDTENTPELTIPVLDMETLKKFNPQAETLNNCEGKDATKRIPITMIPCIDFETFERAVAKASKEQSDKTFYCIQDIDWVANPDATAADIASEKERLLPYIEIEDCDHLGPFWTVEHLFETIEEFYHAKHFHVAGCTIKQYTEVDGITTHKYHSFGTKQ